MSSNQFRFLIFTFLHLNASSYDLRITPRRAHIPVNTRIKVMCQADVPLTACQFKRSFTPAIYDLSAGVKTPNNSDYQYYGVGLEHGQCGLDLREYIKDHTYDLIGCRVKAEDGVWKYSYMSLVVNSNESPIYNMEPRASVVLPGSNHSVLCRAGEELSTCQMKWTTQTWISVSKVTATATYQYYGAGVDKGQCGVTFLNVSEGINGNVFCAGWTKARPKGYESDTTVVIVAKPPDPPRLLLNTTSYADGDLMTAGCVVANSRPVANVTWYLDDELLRQDTLDETVDDAPWRWSYDLQTITQSLKRRLTWQDDGKELVCRAGHLALENGSVDARASLSVQFMPMELDTAPEPVPVTLDEYATFSARVRANPRPSFRWQVGVVNLEDGGADEAGRLRADPARLVDKNLWEATLSIALLTLNDTDLDGVVLTATNALGERVYTIPWQLTSTSSTDDANVTASTDGYDDATAAYASGRAAETGSPTTGIVIGVITVVLLLGVAIFVVQAKIRREWFCSSRLGGGNQAQFRHSICADDEDENDYHSHNVNLDIRQP